MRIFLNRCAYCERSPEELDVAGLPSYLDYEEINDRRILLCDDCRRKYVVGPRRALYETLVNGAAFEFPPNTTEIDHTCAELLSVGYSDDDATFRITLREDNAGTYYCGECPHCGVQLRSLVEA